MKLIGIIGGVASGKSVVARCLAELGAVVIDADAIGHAVLQEPRVEAAARARWGSSIFGPDGHIHRPALAAIVFGAAPNAPAELAFLESLTHPLIRQQLRGRIAQLRAEGACAAAVLDAPVLIKAGWNQLCDKIVYVDAPFPLRRERAAQRGWTSQEFAHREAAQESLAEKQTLADVTIDNSGGLEETRRQVRAFWDSLLAEIRAN